MPPDRMPSQSTPTMKDTRKYVPPIDIVLQLLTLLADEGAGEICAGDLMGKDAGTGLGVNIGVVVGAGSS